MPERDPIFEQIGGDLLLLEKIGKEYLKGNAERKRLYNLRNNLISFCEASPEGATLFLTVGPSQKIHDPQEFGKWYNSLVNGSVFKENFTLWWRVFEQHKDGSWHAHLLIQTNRAIDYREDFNFEAWEMFKAYFSGQRVKRNRGKAYKYLAESCTSNHPIRHLWQVLAGMRDRSGQVGLTMCEPVRTNAEGIGKYLVKYLSKSIIIKKVNQAENRTSAIQRIQSAEGRIPSKEEIDKETPKSPRVRLFSCGGGKPSRSVYSGFSWVSPAARRWRQNVGAFARAAGLTDYEQLGETFGPRWAWNNFDLINNWTGSQEDVYRVHALLMAKAIERWRKY